MTSAQHSPQTRQESRCEALTPDQVQRHGYTPIPTYPGSRAIASCWKVGYGIDVAAGQQADGTWLHLLDLDSHTPEQDAKAQLDRIQRRLGPDLYDRLAIRLSRSGRGYHIVYRTAMPYSQHAFIKVYDPLQPDRHIGELIGPGMRVTFTGTWLQHGPEAIPLLSALELDRLRAAIHTPALYTPQNAPGSSESEPGEHTARKDRMAEGLSLIAGWEDVTDVQQRLETLSQRFEKVEQRLREIRRTPHNRSDAYSHLLQCLMYHAAGLGRDLSERCRVVAAIAIHVGAAGKERERTYKIITDTATLIARILHGDAFLNNPDLHFGIPRWVNAPEIPARPILTTQPQPAKRTAHPHARDRQKNIKKLLRYLHKLPIREYGKRYTSLDDLTELLKVSRRTVQDYLKELRKRGTIRSGQEGGNGPLYIIISEPPTPPKDPCRHAGSPKVEPQTTANNHTNQSADRKAQSPTTTPESPSENPVCTEVLGAPKGSAPAAARLVADPVAALPAHLDDQSKLAGAGFEPLADDLAVSYEPLDDQAGVGASYELAGASREVLDDQAVSCDRSVELADDQADAAGASYDPAVDQIASVPDTAARRRRSRKDPIRARLDRHRRQIERWRAMELGELEVERRKIAGAARDVRRPPQQRQVFADMLPTLDHEIGRKRSAGIQAMYQASGHSTEPPPAVEQMAPASGVVRRVWRRPFVPFDTPTERLPPRELEPHTHPIAELGTDPEAMWAAHEYCERIMAGLRAQGEA